MEYNCYKQGWGISPPVMCNYDECKDEMYINLENIKCPRCGLVHPYTTFYNFVNKAIVINGKTVERWGQCDSNRDVILISDGELY